MKVRNYITVAFGLRMRVDPYQALGKPLKHEKARKKHRQLARLGGKGQENWECKFHLMSCPKHLFH